MKDLEGVRAEGWHPQDVILVGQALYRFALSDELSHPRKIRTWALLFGLIETSELPYGHTDFTGFEYLSDGNGRSLAEWMENQADESWGEELVSTGEDPPP